MPKIDCADLSCVHCRDNGTCSAPRVSLSWHSVVTVNEGRQDFLRCRTYDESPRSKELRRLLDPVFQKGFTEELKNAERE